MDFYSYFSKAENIVQLISLIFFSVITILLFLKTGNVKHLERWLEQYFSEDNHFIGGTDNMKYRTEAYKDTKKSEAQTFDNVLMTYKVNKVTGKLEQVDKKDLQEFINSSLSLCLQSIMDKFLPSPENTDKTNELSEARSVENDIDFMQDYHEKLEAVKEKYNLPDSVTFDGVLDFLDKQHAIISTSIQKDLEKGVSENEKKENK